MSHKPDYDRGRDDAFRWCVTWLHRRANEMNDPHAKTIFNTAAFHLGVETNRPKISSVHALAAALTKDLSAGFQLRVHEWLLACFGVEIAADKMERNHRFIEEALELVQANGCSQSEAHQLVDYVFGRDQGEINQEVGGVMVTLAALCSAISEDMNAEAEKELARVWTKVEQIRAKQAAKPKYSPLPGTVGKEGPAQTGAGLAEELERAVARRRMAVFDTDEETDACNALSDLCMDHANTILAALRAAEAHGEAVEALERMVYEATHLSPRNENGSHDARISGEALSNARAILANLDASQGAEGE